MHTQEWTTRDKTTWGAGEWQDEPDKAQWVDDATGLDCLIVRGPGGAWCGYVGVPNTHPYFEKDYDDCDVRAHGGLTFADRCAEPTPERFAQFEARIAGDREEMKKYPRGDSAERVRTLGHLVGNYTAWCEHMRASAICHVPRAGQPDNVWWLGFDCAHSGDLSPKYMEYGRNMGFSGYEDTYRNRAYVETQVRKLAGQLAAVAG